MKNRGAYLVEEEELHRLEKIVLIPNKESNYVINKELVGKDAWKILKHIGISSRCRIIILKAEKNHPFVTKELLMPILPLVCAENIGEAIQIAKEVEGGNKHTAMIHSSNGEIINRFAEEIDTTVFVANGPCFKGVSNVLSYTIASATGEGVTTASTFTRERRITL